MTFRASECVAKQENRARRAESRRSLRPAPRSAMRRSVLCKVGLTAQNYRSRWPRTLQRSFPEADIDTLLQHY